MLVFPMREPNASVVDVERGQDCLKNIAAGRESDCLMDIVVGTEVEGRTCEAEPWLEC